SHCGRRSRSVPANPRAWRVAEVAPGCADLALGSGETARLPAEHGTDRLARSGRHGVEPEPGPEVVRGAGVVVAPEPFLQATESGGITLRRVLPVQQRQEEVGHVA